MQSELAKTEAKTETKDGGALARARASFDAAWQNFRRRSKYFQFRVYIGVIYAALIVATVIIVVPRGPSNKLGAYVLAARGDFVVGSYIMVRNDSKREWDEVRLTLNGTHAFKAPKLRPGDKLTVALKKFEGPSGALQESDVRQLTIETARGKETYRIDFLR
ncbi:MAG: hypothetical protein IT381_08380 [Deltaproteobacteria bacterium]|nr:hypothetical protein [Deltaproteobacteria bacterium]